MAVVALLAAAVLAPPATAAQHMVVEVVPLAYRSLAEILPVIRPLVPAPGSVSGIGSQLVIKTTPQNLAQIKRVLARLDRAPARLVISVRHTVTADVRRDLLQTQARTGSGGTAVRIGAPGRTTGGIVLYGTGRGTQAGARLLSTHADEDTHDVQRVQVLAGHEAYIQSGQTVPLPERRVVVTGGGVSSVQEGVHYTQVGSGFYVRARLTPGGVTVDISPQRSALSPAGGGAIDEQQVVTSVSGPLGRWMEVGGVDQAGGASEAGISYSTAARSARAHAIYIKVDRLP